MNLKKQAIKKYKRTPSGGSHKKAMLSTIWLTDSCNLNCTYCYVDNKKKQSLSSRDILDVAKFITNHVNNNSIGELTISFHGGEPLLRFIQMEELTDLMKKSAKESNFKVFFQITTNGTLIDKETVGFLKENNFTVSLSIDGQEITHNTNRRYSNGRKSFEDCLRAAYLLRESKILLYIRMTFNSHPHSINNLASNVAFFVENDFSFVKTVPDYFDSNWNKESFQILAEQIKKIAINEPLYWQKKRALLTIIESYCSPFKKMKPCQSGIQELNIGADKKLYPCSFVVGLGDFTIGDIYNGLNISALKKLNKNNAAIKRLECQGCSIIEYCESGRCTYANYRMSGTLDSPNGFFCTFQKLMVKTCAGRKKHQSADLQRVPQTLFLTKT